MAPRKRKPGRASAQPPRVPTPNGGDAPSPAAATGVEVPLAEQLNTPLTSAPKQPVTQQEFLERYAERARIRDAEARAKLIPLAPGERPWPIQVSAVICFVLALANLVLWAAHVRTLGHKVPGTLEMLAFVVLMTVCGIGMWVLWYQAVLAFMVLLGIVILYFCLYLVEASNLLGVLYPVVIVGASGFMFWKLVRVLARLQMPERRSRGTAKG